MHIQKKTCEKLIDFLVEIKKKKQNPKKQILYTLKLVSVGHAKHVSSNEQTNGRTNV